MATSTKSIQDAIHELLTSTRTAKETKAELVELHIAPQDEAMCGSMFKAVVTGFDLTEAQWAKARKFLNEKGHSAGAINQVARFMSGNKGHKNLTLELADCEDDTVDGRIKYLQSERKLPSYKKLYKACCAPSDDAVINKIVKMILALSPELQKRIWNEYDKQATDLGLEAEQQADGITIEQGKRHKINTAKGLQLAMAESA